MKAWFTREGERGKQGDHGQDGQRGAQGPAGKSTALTRVQALVIFFFIVGTGVAFGWRLQVQQADINANYRAVVMTRYQSCLSGVKIVTAFNDHYDQLADIEERLQTDRTLAKARIAVYKDARVIPLPVCGPKP